jgi:hypothetical protein
VHETTDGSEPRLAGPAKAYDQQHNHKHSRIELLQSEHPAAAIHIDIMQQQSQITQSRNIQAQVIR